ncbi:hypothetical protein HanIR_Chr04g0170971 [Helianthus annuus]|nr:hypothetical protein HanIR_Chr04g0170971 [Helianthus annuus]
MHRRIDPSFFLTNKIGAPQGDELGLIKPLAKRSSNCVLNSFISVGANLYGALATGAAPGMISIRNSTCRSGGKPGSSSGKTSGYSEITGISSIFGFGSSMVTCAM